MPYSFFMDRASGTHFVGVQLVTWVETQGYNIGRAWRHSLC